MFNDLSSLRDYFHSRRSSRPRNMIAPGPNDQQLKEIITTALRTPDHGKLSPWRIVSVGLEQRGRLAKELKSAYLKENPDAGKMELEAMHNMAHEAPALLIILSTPTYSAKIPIWEQELSCGAFCMNILHATHSLGFVGGWITGWPAFNDDVRNLFGTEPERIAGFIYLGTANEKLTERPRPKLSDILSIWTPDNP